MLDAMIADPCAPSALDVSVDVEGSALAGVSSREHRHYRGGYHCMYKVVTLGFSTCGEYSVEVHKIPKDLAKREAHRYRVTFSAAGEAGAILRESGAQRRELFMGIRDNMSHRAV